MKKHLVIGLGEVGSALQNILNCDGYDPYKNGGKLDGPYDVIHICFPFSDGFKQEVKRYAENGAGGYGKALVVVHSSVPLGTCDPEGWVHSPIRGVHPELEKGIRTFTKYFGGERAEEAGQYFHEIGIDCVVTKKAITTEALKLWDTTQYGMMIAIQKEIFAFCTMNDIDFSLVYQHANRTYNEGYIALGKPEVVRPYLKHIPGPIGGHCVIPNAELLDTPTAKFIISTNDGLEKYKHSGL